MLKQNEADKVVPIRKITQVEKEALGVQSFVELKPQISKAAKLV